MTQPTPRRSLLAIVLFGLLPFIAPLVRGEIFSFRDHADYFVPLRHFTAESLRSGELPMWNPYNGSGERWLANPQTAIFYPPAVVFLALPFRVAYLLFLAFHVVLIGAGSFLLFLRWCSPGAALAGALTAMLGGPSLSLLDINNNLASFAWLPLLMWIATAASRSFARVAIPAGCVIALMFLAGEPYLALTGALVYAVVLIARREFSLLAASAAIAAALPAVQLLPFLEMLRGSDRAAGLSPDLAFAESLSPAEWSVVALSPSASPTQLIPSTQYFIPSLYLGPVVVFGVFLAVLCLSRDRDALPGRALAGFGLLFALFAVIAAGAYLPWIANGLIRAGAAASRHASRVAPVAALGLVGVGAIGLDRIREAPLYARVASLVATFALIALSASRILLLWPDASLLAIARPMLLFAALAAVVFFASRISLRPSIVFAACAIVAVDLVAGAAPLLRSAPFSPTVPEFSDAITSDRRFVRLEEPGRGRLFRFERRAWYAGYLNLLDRDYDVSTPAPVVPFRYLRFHDAIVADGRLDLANFLAAGYIVTSRDLASPALTREARVGRVTVYRNAAARPMFTLWRDFVAASDDDEALRMIEQRRVSIARTPVVSSPPPDLRARLAAGANPKLEARMWYQLGSRPGAKVRSTQPVILAFSQLDAKGWRLTIDGSPAESLRINGLFLGAVVPAGEHVISWSYRTPYLATGATISFLTLLAVLTSVVFAMRRREF